MSFSSWCRNELASLTGPGPVSPLLFSLPLVWRNMSVSYFCAHDCVFKSPLKSEYMLKGIHNITRISRGVQRNCGNSLKAVALMWSRKPHDCHHLIKKWIDLSWPFKVKLLWGVKSSDCVPKSATLVLTNQGTCLIPFSALFFIKKKKLFVKNWHHTLCAEESCLVHATSGNFCHSLMPLLSTLI